MSYSAPYLDKSGIHLPTYDERLEKLVTDYKTIFGQDVYLKEDAMDYQLMSLIAKCWTDLNAVITDMYNSRNPGYATGAALDILVALNGVKRLEATHSTAVLQLTGEAGMTIEGGQQAMDKNGHVWVIAKPVTFDNDGTAEADAACLDAGAIIAEPGDIQEINTPVANWYAVNNNKAAEPGRNIETDAELRVRRALSVGGGSMSMVESIRSKLINLPGAEFVKVYNYDDERHAVECVIEGGEDADIAEAIWRKKAPGVGTVGTSAADYVDPYGYKNTIRFTRPKVTDVKTEIDIKVFQKLDQLSAGAAIRAAVIDYMDHLAIGQKLVVPALLSVIFMAIPTKEPVFTVTSVKAQKDGEMEAKTDVIEAGVAELLRSAAGSVIVNFTI